MLGREQGETNSNRGNGSSSASPINTSASNSGSKSMNKDTEKSTRKTRTEWMRSYVKPEKDAVGEGRKGSEPSRELISAIDEAAMKAVINYELNREFKPERQPHFNPGYDVLSRSIKSGKRLISQGLDGEWTLRR